MPAIIRGFVDTDIDNGCAYLRDVSGADAVARLLERYKGKNIDMVISIRERTS